MTMKRVKRTIAAGEFKAKCLALLDDVCQTGQPLIVTKRGKPVVEVVAVKGARSLRGSLVREEDVVSPIDTGWDAAS